MINVGDFCIDSTEVTRDDYAEFRAAIGTTNAMQPASCSWNTSFDAAAVNDSTTGDLPITGVDWCDAFAYCAWAGKRLCGRPAGGSAPYDAPSDEAQSSWYAACSAGSKVFPYGAEYDPQACNGGDYDGPDVALVPVGNVTTCEGGYSGIFDMSGNAWEWEDSCQTSSGPEDLCRARGGGFGNGGQFHRCDYAEFSPARNFHGPVGIRCCANAK
jgi:formylglycine-generating enzyme required for sulfatase activity